MDLVYIFIKSYFPSAIFINFTFISCHSWKCFLRSGPKFAHSVLSHTKPDFSPNFTNIPYDSILVILPKNSSHILGSKTSFCIISIACWVASRSLDVIIHVPSSSKSILTHVAAIILSIVSHHLPITILILSGSTCSTMIRGAWSGISALGLSSVCSIKSSISALATFARVIIWRAISVDIPLTLVSSWIAVTHAAVHATLKSISHNISSSHWISVSISYWSMLPSWWLVDASHIAIPLTGALIGTPASMSESVDAHTAPIDVDHHDHRHSETVLIVYGKLFFSGITFSTAFSASLPCHISRRHGALILIASLTLNCGKL